ncbi:MAG: hypothetical protein AAFR65_14175 [Pseudomonadota bacterium]
MIIQAVASLLAAVAQAATPAPVPCSDEAYSDFDFWVGVWDVYSGDQLAGRNVITKEESGCLVLETWTSARGSTGQSYNYYDPAKDKWRQVWVSAGIFIDYEGGLDDQGRMVLEGTITSNTDGKVAPFRGQWAPLDDGTVQQTFWTYDAEADSWNIWFDGNYRRAE